MKLLATAPLEQESESSTIVFLVPDDVLKMPLTYWLVIGTKRISGERICRKDIMFLDLEHGYFYISVHVLLH